MTNHNRPHLNTDTGWAAFQSSPIIADRSIAPSKYLSRAGRAAPSNRLWLRNSLILNVLVSLTPIIRMLTIIMNIFILD